MKYDRIQEVLRYITPGLYLLALLLVVNFDVIQKNEKTLTAASAIIVVLIPFVGFVAGYFVECLMTVIERFLYWIQVPRPSKVVLNASRRSYLLEEAARRKILCGSGEVDNKTANRYRQEAKQVVGLNELVDRYYYQSIMARHILGAQIIATVYYFVVAESWSWCHSSLAIIVIALLACFWYHQNCVYMKYLFSEYGKTIKEKKSNERTETDTGGDPL